MSDQQVKKAMENNKCGERPNGKVQSLDFWLE